jgi:hypothetical protein
VTTATPLLPAAVPAVRRAAALEFLAVGGATLVLFPLAWIARAAIGLDAAELAIGFLTFHAAFLINDPHFAVTYVLFYEDVRRRAFGAELPPALRVRYLLAGFLVPTALVAWAALAVTAGSARALGWLVELMFFLVRWHYVKQAFGVLVVLSARRGVRYTQLERRAVLGHCFAAWAYAWARAGGPSREVEEKGVVYTTLAEPAFLRPAAGIAFAVSAGLLAWTLLRKWRRERRPPPFAPLAGLLLTVWIWTVYSSVDPLMIYVIPALHSVQYLYFVGLLTKSRAAEAEANFGPPPRARIALLALSSVALGWILLRGAPAFLDGARPRALRMSDLGATPWLAAIFAVVNIHHYFMDNVIWRRDSPAMRHLR